LDGQVDAAVLPMLERAWSGEWYGVCVYEGLAEARQDADQASSLRELVALETYVLGELTTALVAFGVEPDPQRVADEVDRDLSTHRDDPWPALLEWLATDAEMALAEHLPLVELAEGDPDLAALADLVVAHERALIAFARGSAAGASEPLAEVRALLGPGAEP
jgi:hypothetical protein